MLNKSILSEISGILTPEQLAQSRSMHIEVHNGFAYGKVIFTSPNDGLLTELRNDLDEFGQYFSNEGSIQIPTKSGRGALLIASKIAEELKSKGIEVTQSEKAFR